MTISDEARRVCARMLSEGEDLESVLSYMRRAGVSKTESIKVLVELNWTKLGQAKMLVHHSDTWADVRQRDEEFHRTVEDNLKKE